MNNLKKPYPGIGQSFGLMFIMLGVTLAVTLIIGLAFLPFGYNMIGQNVEPSPAKNIFEFLSYTVSGIIAFAIGYRMRKASGITEGIGFKNVPFSTYIASIIVVLCFGFTQDIITYVFPIPEWVLNLFSELNQKDIFVFTTVVISAPLLEELLFRGVILDGLLRRENASKAIFISALIFGLIHFIPWQAGPALLMGLFLGWLYWRTRSLILCIALHAVNNFTATIVGWSMAESQTPFIDLMGFQSYLIAFVMAIIIIIGVLRLLNKRLLPAAPQPAIPIHEETGDLPM